VSPVAAKVNESTFPSLMAITFFARSSCSWLGASDGPLGAVASKVNVNRFALIALHEEKSPGMNIMKKWIKYALGALFVCLVVVFFGRERMTTMYTSSDEPAKPEILKPPYGNILVTEGGDDMSPIPGQIGNDLPMGNE
jgi:hypothetical protein